MKVFVAKLKESATSILPIVGIVLLLSFTPVFSIDTFEKIVFLISAVILILGMTLFSIGAELSMMPMGDYAGSGLVKTRKLSIILFVALLMGFLVTIAEPDLLVLSQQVEAMINPQSFVMSVGVGVGIFLLIALLKMVFNKQLSILLLLFYMLLFALTALICETGKSGLIPLAYDSGGVTTGPITVPFIMAFGVGIASTLGGKNANENSFGLVSLCSIGPMLVVIAFLLLAKGDMPYSLPDYSMQAVFAEGILHILIHEAVSVLKALSFVFLFFMALNILILKLPVKKLLQIVIGMLITLTGLALFLTAAQLGFLPVGFTLGKQIVNSSNLISMGLCLVIGMTVVLAEPAIHVLTNQVEDVTGGTVTRRSMLIALSIGVGIAITLSIVRILNGFSILYYLIPGYFLSLALSVFVPPLYTAIAFDSGGVASGPLTSTFILPFMIGACAEVAGADKVMSLAFGVVSLVAMTPLISIQLLGFRAVMAKIVRDRISMGRILRADDNQIIYFE